MPAAKKNASRAHASPFSRVALGLARFAVVAALVSMAAPSCSLAPDDDEDPHVAIAALASTPWGQFEQTGCSAGVAASCSALAAAFREGRNGLSADARRARQLRRRACALGDAPSCAAVAGGR
jgi:hypothetical protein